jgi:HNH endonuclease
VGILEFHPFNRPDLTFRIDATYAHLLAKCRRWHAVKKPKSLTFYIQGCDGAAEPTVYLHRLIMGAPEEMTVSHKDGDGLNNVRSNLMVATRSMSAARAVNVLKRGNFKPAGEPIENKVRKVLADGTTRIYVHDRRTRLLLRSWDENSLATKSANRVQTGSALGNPWKGKAHTA